ncbi:hypothetical protein OIU91_40825 (plasmid) [Streptomyces sp. NBC_01456]|uniref:hypothetical protein n=1 Tax=Streptomyces sp. NBC_01456 TaxID=2975868 RepID=UPI002E2ECFD4|nr:hypothetical protein [Streptomyces sp. NBC_01456]
MAPSPGLAGPGISLSAFAPGDRIRGLGRPAARPPSLRPPQRRPAPRLPLPSRPCRARAARSPAAVLP